MILRNCKITIQEKKYDGLKIYMLKFILKRKKDKSVDSLSPSPLSSPREDRTRRQPSASPKEGPHQKLTMLTP